MTQVVKNPPARIRKRFNPWIQSLGQGSCPEERNDNPLQYPCLGNPMDRETWRATVHGVPESDMAENTGHV